MARDSANRWVDNVEALRDWLLRRFEGHEEQLASFLREAGADGELQYASLPARA